MNRGEVQKYIEKRYPGFFVKCKMTAPEDDINQFLVESCARIDGCNLKTIVTPFFDFTSWNPHPAGETSKTRHFS